MSLSETISSGKALFRDLFLKKLFISLIIILVAILSFGIGRLSMIGKLREPIKIEYDEAIVTKPQTNTNQSATALNALNKEGIVVSKNGSKYHYSHCAGAKQIKEENKITFDTKESAEAAGYTLASNCKPR